MKSAVWKRFKNGRTIKDTLHYMAKLVRAGVDLFDVDLGCYDNWWLPHPPEECRRDVSLICPRSQRILPQKSYQIEYRSGRSGCCSRKTGGYPDIAEKSIRMVLRHGDACQTTACRSGLVQQGVCRQCGGDPAVYRLSGRLR